MPAAPSGTGEFDALLRHMAGKGGRRVFAVRDAVIDGTEIENFAVAEIDAAEVRLRLFDRDGRNVAAG